VQRQRTARRGKEDRITTKDFAVFNGDSHVVEHIHRHLPVR
jgi:hypothetical protein